MAGRPTCCSREFSALYEAYSRGASSPLPELEVQYADYVLWQLNLAARRSAGSAQGILARATRGCAVLELATDKPRPAVASSRGDAVHFELPPDLTAGLNRLSADQNVTLFMLLLAAWQVLLSRYSGQDDLVMGVPVANRPRSEFEALIGYFLNTLALRIDLSGDPRFVDLLAHVRDRTLQAYDHQSLPFEHLIGVRGLERNGAGSRWWK